MDKLFFLLLFLIAFKPVGVFSKVLNHAYLSFTDKVPKVDGDPKYRNRCEFGEIDNNDFLVYPGVKNGSPHKHVHFGAFGTTENSNASDLKKMPTTCWGGFIKSAGWFPGLVTKIGDEPITDGHVTLYYSKGSGGPGWVNAPGSIIHDLPDGFTVISGSPHNSGLNEWLTKNSKLKFSCTYKTGGTYNVGPTLPICNSNSILQIRMTAPSCVSGKLIPDGNGGTKVQIDKDSPDHISHLAYPRTGNWKSFGNINECPSTHPYRTLTISFLITYNHPIVFQSLNWKISENVFFHFDYVKSTNDFLFDRAINDCPKSGKDCGVGIIGTSGMITAHPDFRDVSDIQE